MNFGIILSKGKKVPLSDFIIESMGVFGYKNLATLNRNIVNKTMPYLNSPTNVHGKVTKTMDKENILIFDRN